MIAGPALSLPLRLLRRRRGAVLAFAAVYGFGFSAFLVVDALVRGYAGEVRAKSRELLEGDLRIQTRRPLTAEEAAKAESAMPAGTRRAEVWGFLSMARGGDEARLVQVRAVTPQYPLFGAFRFAPDFDLAAWKPGEALVPPELGATLGLGLGDTLHVGSKGFRVAGFFTDRPGSHFSFWDFGSRVYIPMGDMPATGLESKGSRIFRYRFYQLPEGADAAGLRRELQTRLPDPEIDISAYDDSDNDLGRTLGWVAGFLQLVSLCVFWLAAAAGAFFFRHHLAGERRAIAVLKTLGASPRRIFALYLFQNLGLALCAAVLALGLAALEAAALRPWLESRLQSSAGSGLPAATALLGLVLLPVTAVLFSAGDLLAAARVPAAALFRPSEGATLPRAAAWALTAGRGIFFAVLAFAFSRSLILTGAATVTVAVGLVLLLTLGGALLALLWSRRARLGYGARMTLGVFRFGREKAQAAFLALGFVAFAAALIPSLRSALIRELQAPAGADVPHLFLFDVQEEQIDSVKSWLAERGRAPRDLSPMVRARLEKVNSRPFRRDSALAATVEERRNRQFRNRGYNLSYREALGSSERVVAGAFWTRPAPEDALPEVSVEEDFAQRLRFGLGDTLAFDVQGVEVSGVITSLRRVRWTSFQPNFFVIFQPGALEMAPKTFLGTVGPCAPGEADTLQAGLAKTFPAVTALNLRQAVERLLSLLDALQAAVSLLAAFAAVVGLAMLVVVAEAMARDLERPALLLQVLGEPPGRMARRMAAHFALFAGISGLCGIALSQAAAFAVCRFLWKMPWQPDWGTILLSGSLSALAGLGSAGYAWVRSRRRSPRALLAL